MQYGQEIAILMILLEICEVNYFYFHARKSENRAAEGRKKLNMIGQRKISTACAYCTHVSYRIV